MKKNNTTNNSPVFINMNACDGCGLCSEICPTNVILMKRLNDDELKELSFLGRLKVRIKGNTKSHVARPEECIRCGKCESNCHEHAITVRRINKNA